MGSGLDKIRNPFTFAHMNKVRIDKWLWCVRIYKSRTISTDACKAGKVRIGDVAVKPSYLVGIDEVVVVKKDGFNFEYKVIDLIEKRVGAPIAAACYLDITPEAERNKYTAWFANATGRAEIREKGTGRPTKRERRDIDDFKEGDLDENEHDDE